MLWFKRKEVKILCTHGGCVLCKRIPLWMTVVPSREGIQDPLFANLNLSASLCCLFRAGLLAGWQSSSIVILKSSGKIAVLLQWQWIWTHFTKCFCLPCILALILSTELLRFLGLRETDVKSKELLTKQNAHWIARGVEELGVQFCIFERQFGKQGLVEYPYREEKSAQKQMAIFMWFIKQVLLTLLYLKWTAVET